MKSRFKASAATLLVATGCAAKTTPPEGSGRASGAPLALPTSFQWSSSPPLVGPKPSDSRPLVSVKDPSFVFFEGRFHLFATTASQSAGWSMLYTSFSDFAEAASGPRYHFADHPALEGYHCAPQVFYFRPQKRWYLVFQSGQPQYSTTDDITRPESWSAPRDFFSAVPGIVANDAGGGTWLDFWVICDEARCHLFFTDDAGSFYRSETTIDRFPVGFSEPVVALRGTKESLYEASATYRVKSTGTYLTLIEAFGPTGRRYYRSFVASALDGEWLPLADTWEAPFAGASNVRFEGGAAWTSDVSHGELVRDGYDETLTIDPKQLQFLYQGVDPARSSVPYFELPYRLALLTATR